MITEFARNFPEISALLISATGMTLVVTLGSAAVATLLGLFFAYLASSRHAFLRVLSSTYVALARAIPTLSLLFLVYYGLPSFNIRLQPIPTALIGFGIHGGAYVTEIIRAALLSVPAGQREAALSIGMTPLQSMRYILFPQAGKTAIPPYFNYVLQLLKDTSIASAIAVPELMFRARGIANQMDLTDLMYLYAAVIYLALSLSLSRFASAVEKRLWTGMRAAQ
ncbi:ABC transporter permease subunit [Rhizobium lusitanum]|uniref:ABC transporter permease subunit n=1 Tax=Rhizobium lusitanum TaxID=293958 RepID=A0A6L9UIA3_9HYPH|nr:amino acid ABC transporter permease [Rhizobium lusitanum]NEI73600.1 ABC transporter permease subunit [Rhizobium lusitanum]